MAAGSRSAADCHPRPRPDPLAVGGRADREARGDRTPGSGNGSATLPGVAGSREVLASGVVTRLHDELYARLPHGRLALLGAPGAGKTAAMLLLMLAALDHRAGLGDSDERERVPVPVWLTLGGWDPAAVTLKEWAVSRMNLDHPALRAPEYGPNVAGELLREGLVALFLDGLDEMPKSLRPMALERISAEAAGLRLVLTSRPDEYQDSVSASSLDNTAVATLLPVRPAAAGAFLLRGQSGVQRERWSDFTDSLKRQPDGSAAKALDNPLLLSLARDADATKTLPRWPTRRYSLTLSPSGYT